MAEHTEPRGRRTAQAVDFEPGPGFVPPNMTVAAMPADDEGRQVPDLMTALQRSIDAARNARPADEGRQEPRTESITREDRVADVPREDVDRWARLLMAEWERVEGKPVNASYVATFADMGRVAARAANAADERLRLIEAECDRAEEHARHVMGDEVLVEVGLIRNGIAGVAEEMVNRG